MAYSVMSHLFVRRPQNPYTSTWYLKCLPTTNPASNNHPLLLSSFSPDKERRIERIMNSRGIRTFLIMNHIANLRKNSNVSAVWGLFKGLKGSWKRAEGLQVPALRVPCSHYAKGERPLPHVPKSLVHPLAKSLGP